MRPHGLQTKIFLDSGDPNETKQILDKLGFLDGQTTNPSLIAKNPEIIKRTENGSSLTKADIDVLYKEIVTEIAQMIPQGSVSVEVYADTTSTVIDLLGQARAMHGWIPNAHIKFPTIPSGLAAAHEAVKEGMRVNMTLVFNQEQAAAVYAATVGAKVGDVFVSPFVGRLDDKGIDGMNLIKNIITMYAPTDKHVSVLTASVRSLDHMVYAMAMGSDIITAPFSVLNAWADSGKVMPTSAYVYKKPNLQPVAYETLSLDKPFASYAITHPLTDAGLARFMDDYQKLYQKQ